MSQAKRNRDVSERKTDYIFDSRGYFIYQNFLSHKNVQVARNELRRLKFTPETWAPSQYRTSNIHKADGFLADLGTALHSHPLTRRLIGYPPRLIESYALDRTAHGLDLHGGSSEFLRNTDIHDISARSWVQDRRIYSLRVKILIYLDNVSGPTAGRLAYIEGSHKSAFSFHRTFQKGRREAGNLTRTVDVRAGDAIWLNEALLHGAENKTSKRKRRLLAYTYGPSFMSEWSELNDSLSNRTGYFPVETEGRHQR